MTCHNCGGSYTGDGYAIPLICENAHPLTAEFAEPDAGPFECEVCQGVDGPCENVALTRRQNTEYADDSKNWVTQCDECFAITQANWKELWSEYSTDVYVGLNTNSPDADFR